MKKSNLLFTLIALMALCSCTNATESKETGNRCPDVAKCTEENDPPLETPETDKLEFPFEDTYAENDFEEAESGVVAAKAQLTYVTDGDTATFKTVNGHTIKCRFLGVNTPESTADVEPWGVRASAFAKRVLLSAKDWCLVNDIGVYGKRDNTSSQRNLAFVWYKTDEGDWRLYNLECVEQGYSQRTLFNDSDTLKYLAPFQAADERGKECKYRVYGDKNDCTYDYSDDVKEVTIYQVLHRYDELGITDKSSGKMLHITALVVGLIGDNLVVRDVQRDLDQEDDDPLATLYAYSGFSGSLGSYVGVGDIVSFYCRATTFGENIQLSDLKKDSYGKYPFEVLVDVSEGDDYGPYIHDMETISVPYGEDFTSLNGYVSQYVDIDIEIREIANGDYDDDGNIINVDPDNPTKYYNQSEKSPYSETIYGKVRGTKQYCNIRIDGNCTPKLSHTNFQVGHIYHLKGYLNPYYNNYQLAMFNNTAKYHYCTEVTDA